MSHQLRREAIEQVLRKHQIRSVCQQGAPDHAFHTEELCPFLLDDLLACFPQEPSLEALEKILSQCEVEIDEEKYRIIATKGLLHNKLVERLLIWATGKTEETRWCQEIIFDHERWWFHPSEPHAGTHPVPSTWMVCPICRKERPSERT